MDAHHACLRYKVEPSSTNLIDDKHVVKPLQTLTTPAGVIMNPAFFPVRKNL